MPTETAHTGYWLCAVFCSDLYLKRHFLLLIKYQRSGYSGL